MRLICIQHYKVSKFTKFFIKDATALGRQNWEDYPCDCDPCDVKTQFEQHDIW